MFDISERKRAELALRESEEQNRLLFEESPDAITLLHVDGTIIRSNHAYALMTGIARDEMVGKSLLGLGLIAREESVQIGKSVIEAMSRRKNFVATEYTLVDSGGRKLHVESRLFLLNIGGSDQVLMSTRDITLRKQAEEALRRANQELERAMRMKDEFLASMSHELRTPLTGILGISEGMLEQVYGPLSDRQRKALTNIESSGRHLLDLINDILDLSKLEAGKLSLEVDTFPLSQVCRSSLQLIKGMAQKKGQRVNFYMDPPEIMMQGDIRRVKQILVNLLSNAVKYTREGGTLGLEVEGNQTGQVVNLSVWDTGIGIRSEDLNKLFKPFVQLDSSLARQQTGTGLGLSLVQNLAALHGGSIAVESSYGEGSRFTVTLPWIQKQPMAHEDEAAAAPVQAGTSETNLIPSGILIPPNTGLMKERQYTVMVVDDDELNTVILVDFLSSKDFRVVPVRNGQQFLEQVQQVSPHVILMDIQMPGIDGMEVIRRLRAHPDGRTAAIPVIAVTALAMTGDREKCLAAGADEYVSKPFRLNELEAVIHGLLQKQSQ